MKQLSTKYCVNVKWALLSSYIYLHLTQRIFHYISINWDILEKVENINTKQLTEKEKLTLMMVLHYLNN